MTSLGPSAWCDANCLDIVRYQAPTVVAWCDSGIDHNNNNYNDDCRCGRDECRGFSMNDDSDDDGDDGDSNDDDGNDDGDTYIRCADQHCCCHGYVDDDDEEETSNKSVTAVAGVKRKYTCLTDTLVYCKTHGLGDDKMAVAFKNNKCRQCTTVKCKTCGPGSLANIHRMCIKCLNDRNAKRNATNEATNGSGTHTVKNACTLEKHADCTLHDVGNRCFRCYKNHASVQRAAIRARDSPKDLRECEIKSCNVYDMEGTPCSVCTRPVVQLVAPNDPLGLSLDRTDPSIGYTRANTTVMHAQCNYLKGERTTAETRATLLGIYRTFMNGGIIFGAPMDKQAAEWFTDDEASCRKRNRHVYKYFTTAKKAHAKNNDTEFTITWEETKALFEGQNGQCALCSIPCGRDMSFDQIVAGLGYVENNVQFVHRDCNSGKNRWSMSDLHTTATALAASTATATSTTATTSS